MRRRSEWVMWISGSRWLLRLPVSSDPGQVIHTRMVFASDPLSVFCLFTVVSASEVTTVWHYRNLSNLI